MPNDPAYIDKITSIEPIGSNGETHDEKRDNYHVKIEISNCYYYEDNIPKSIQKIIKLKRYGVLIQMQIGTTLILQPFLSAGQKWQGR